MRLAAIITFQKDSRSGGIIRVNEGHNSARTMNSSFVGQKKNVFCPERKTSQRLSCNYYLVTFASDMGTREKLIERFKTIPSDFTFDELERLLAIFGFEHSNKGKTSGSRVVFKIMHSNRYWMN